MMNIIGGEKRQKLFWINFNKRGSKTLNED